VGGLEVYRNTAFVPRAWIAPAGTDLATLEPPAEPRGAPVRAAGSGRLQIDVQTAEAGYLILSELWYPGWQATVDGAPAAIEVATDTFIAVPLPAGASTVEVRFWPATFTWGIVAALAGLIMVVLALSFFGRRRRTGDG
jgi:uncharacterized membrane protein YfhO